MDINPAVVYGSEGIPANDRLKASALTLRGYNANLQRYGAMQLNDVSAAADGMKVALRNRARRPYRQGGNPYGRVLNSPMFHAGMGDADWSADYDAEMSAIAKPSSPPANAAGTSWLDVVNTIGGNLAKGVANKIGGPSTVVKMAPQPSSTPSWVVPAAIVGGVGALYFLLRRS